MYPNFYHGNDTWQLWHCFCYNSKGNICLSSFLGGRDTETAAPTIVTVKPAVAPGGAAALAIVMLIVGVLLVAIPFYFVSVRNNKSMESFRKSQLTMSDMQEWANLPVDTHLVPDFQSNRNYLLMCIIWLSLATGHVKNIPTMHFFPGISRNTPSKSYIL